MSIMDPPSKLQVAEAKLAITDCENKIGSLESQITAEELQVVKIIREATEHLSALQAQKAAQQKRLANARALLSPIRYMPAELLGNVFINAFEEDPFVAWRQVSLEYIISASANNLVARPDWPPKYFFASLGLSFAQAKCTVWTRIHVKTNARTSPELFRLWLERSGNTLPLDIDITLFDPTPNNEPSRAHRRRRAGSEGISFAPPSPGFPDLPSPPPFSSSVLPFPLGGSTIPPISPPPVVPLDPPGQDPIGPQLPQFNPPSMQLGSILGNGGPGIGFGVAGGLGPLLAALASLNPGGAVAGLVASWASNNNGPGGLPPPPPPPPQFPSIFDGPPSPITELPLDSGNDSDDDADGHGLPLPMSMPVPLPAVRPYSPLSRPNCSRAIQSWGHIVLHYLLGVMPRWRRFVFQFENITGALPGWTALEGLNVKAPLLEEFAVVCSDARGATTPWINEWSWLPTSLKPQMAPKLRSLELRNMPFAWNSPVLSGLTTLRLGQPLAMTSGSNVRRFQQMTLITLGLDRLLTLLQRNPRLENLEIHVQLNDPLLPLEPTELPCLTSLSISGGRNASSLLEHIKLPALQVLDVHITARSDMDDVLSQLYVRSGSPPVREFRYVAGQRTGWGSSFTGSGPFPVTFLDHISDTIRRLVAVKCTLQTLLSELADAREGNILCPSLRRLCLFECHSQHNFVQQLIRLVDVRNPAGSIGTANTGIPWRLETLSLRGGPDLDTDVIDWLKTRVADVQYVDSKTPGR
ncbi:hypothetical protein RhiJN_09945 [Ceratobasidium sp. AG-Ba]|nr:hypothetical protein RhiJN_09945 [Ceratobasidium sp. AG-Ba]QRW10707.1 hypothetical protein RhiLY_09706 [Ceratobasidium sp. AG-Ba]